MTTPSAIDAALLHLESTDLATVVAGAELQRRYDSKFLLSAATVARLVSALDENWRVLDVGGHRATGYVSAYYDDEHFTLFRDHLQGRRLRYKVRTRRYGGAEEEMLEIKLKSGRGATEKHRIARNTTHVALTTSERQWLSDAVVATYGQRPLAPLDRVLGLHYTRRTLYNATTSERVTIDTNLAAEATSGARSEPIGTAVVVEVKSALWLGETVRFVRGQGLRPLSFSKYCTAVAALHPDADQRLRRAALREYSLRA